MKNCRFIEDVIYFCGNFMINKVTVFLCTVCRTLIKFFKIYKCDEKSFFPAHSKGSNNYLLSVTYKYGLVINMSLFSPKRTKVKNNKKEPF